MTKTCIDLNKLHSAGSSNNVNVHKPNQMELYQIAMQALNPKVQLVKFEPKRVKIPRYNHKLAIALKSTLYPGAACSVCVELTVDALLNENTSPKELKNWNSEGKNNIILEVDTFDDLLNRAIKNNVVITPYMQDGEMIAIALGPDKKEVINKVIGNTSLY